MEYANASVKYNLSRIIPTRRPLRDAISPMIKTRWGQGRPYSLLCPYNYVDKQKTGEIATAMAQLMRYWQYPEHGKGVVTVLKNNLPMERIALDTVIFDWNNMTALYNSSSTEREKEAVATLMLACGASILTDYAPYPSNVPTASSKKVPDALIDKFGYAPSAYLYDRRYYSLSTWEEMIYTSLDSGCPVYYTAGGLYGNYCFICDGYEGEGYFHINWGLEGDYDGFFRLTALPPNLPFTTDIGLYNNQFAIINIKPDFEGSRPAYVVGYKDPYTMSYKLSERRLTINGTCTNWSKTNIPNIQFGILLVHNSGITKYIDSGITFSEFSTYTKYGYVTDLSVTLPTGLQAGTYSIYPYFETPGQDSIMESHLIVSPLTCVNQYKLIVSQNGTPTLMVETRNSIETSNFELVSPPIYKDKFGFKCDLVNNSEVEAYRGLYLGLYDANDKLIGTSGDCIMKASIPPGDTLHVEKIIPFPYCIYDLHSEYGYSAYDAIYLKAGESYKLGLLTRLDDDNLVKTYYQVSNLTPTVTIEDVQTVDLSSKGISIEQSDSINATKDIHFSIDVTANEGYYLYPLYYTVYAQTDHCTLYNGNTDEIIVAPGETKVINWKFPFEKAVKGNEYVLQVKALLNGNEVVIAEKPFTVSTSGMLGKENMCANDFAVSIVGETAKLYAPGNITSTEVYSMQGVRQNVPITFIGETASIDMESLFTGIYMVRIHTSSRSTTLKIVKK